MMKSSGACALNFQIWDRQTDASISNKGLIWGESWIRVFIKFVG